MPPDPPPSRLNQQQQARQESPQQSRQGLEFAGVEDLLRHDREQTPPPTALEARVQQSIAAEPPPSRPWWKKWFKR
jgi:hypothetical protein